AGKSRGRGVLMKCTTVRENLAGYLDDALIGEERVRERAAISKHLDSCSGCRKELQRFRKLAVLLSRVPKSVPPADLVVRIKVAASQAQQSQNWSSRFRHFREHAAIVLENVFRPLTVPATGGLVSALVVFAMVFQMIVPGIAVRAVENDVPINLMRPAKMVSLSDYPEVWPEKHESELSLPHGLLVDVTVDAQGHMTDYHILSGPTSLELRRQLDQMLLFSRFSPMLSFGRPTAGGHVVLSFSAVRVHG
ncbi:MAG TPA: zf-HC2 domain-containing protein, partial [Candidatus Dormibacteraeota bacterium]|nr:zf-HC2 domain-containing protein [Candidatus Dormibacteraeota bacterium]